MLFSFLGGDHVNFATFDGFAILLVIGLAMLGDVASDLMSSGRNREGGEYRE
jgi:hypothetical protein